MSRAAWIIAIILFVAAFTEIMTSSSALGDRSFLESLRLQVGHLFVLYQSGAVTMFDNFGFNQILIAHLDNYVKDK